MHGGEEEREREMAEKDEREVEKRRTQDFVRETGRRRWRRFF